jgi:hypothetical protein
MMHPWNTWRFEKAVLSLLGRQQMMHPWNAWRFEKAVLSLPERQ